MFIQNMKMNWKYFLSYSVPETAAFLPIYISINIYEILKGNEKPITE